MFKSLFISIIILIGNSAMAIEEPRFTVITEEKPFEIRVYEPMIIAEVQVSGDRDSATNQGFRLIADYIFGNNEGANQASQKIAMTAPVTIEKQTQAKLPVSSTQEELADGVWRIQFVMPSEYTLTSLPKPKNNLIKIIEDEEPVKSNTLTKKDLELAMKRMGFTKNTVIYTEFLKN